MINKPTTSKVDKKIVGYSVGAKDAIAEMKAAVAAETEVKTEPKLEVMSFDWRRPPTLPASVYKIEKCPNSPDAAVYVTISNAVLNGETEHKQIVPAEIFINSKDVSHQQWITALTRVISAIFRKGGNLEFLTEELLGICDPGAGFLQKGVWHPSLVSQVGGVIKAHLKGLKEKESWILASDKQNEFIDFSALDKVEETHSKWLAEEEPEADEASSYPPNATICPKCNHKAVVLMDGCSTCLSCGESKCS